MLPELIDMGVYEDAAFYDIEFAERSHDAEFFIAQALAIGGPVLEVACGTGRITLPIARSGLEVTGLDVMRPMLDLAKQKAKREGLRIEWLQQDCREIRSDTKFKLIFSATNAMQHLHDLASVNAFLQSAKRSLAPGGILILDVFNPDLAKLMRMPSERYIHKRVKDLDGTDLSVEATTRYDAALQILFFDLHYMRGTTCVRTKKVSMRCFYPQELMALCTLNGLKVVRRHGGYDLSDFDSKSPKQILFCQDDGSR